MKMKVDCDVYSWVEDDKLLTDISFDGENWHTQSVNLTTLFGEYMEGRRVYGTNEIPPHHQKEVTAMIALLRFIARDMETELQGSRG